MWKGCEWPDVGRAGVGVAPGVDFGQAGKRAVRFSYASSEEYIREAARRLREYLERRTSHRGCPERVNFLMSRGSCCHLKGRRVAGRGAGRSGRGAEHGLGPDGKRAVRFSYAISEENIREAARRLGVYLGRKGSNFRGTRLHAVLPSRHDSTRTARQRFNDSRWP